MKDYGVLSVVAMMKHLTKFFLWPLVYFSLS
jgi:hypothetical protein